MSCDSRPSARDGIVLRKFGQQIIERLGGKRIHPAWIVPGGVSERLSQQDRDAILSTIPEALVIAARSLDWFKRIAERFHEEIEFFGNFPSLFMALVKRDGGLTFYDGDPHFVNGTGHQIGGNLYPTRYFNYLGEKVEPWSYLKSAYFLPRGFLKGI